MAKRDPIAILARLERQELDARRGVLVAAQGEQERLAALVAQHDGHWREAVDLALAAEAEIDLWGALSRGTRQVLDQSEQRRATQAVTLGKAQAEVLESLVDLKRLEVLAERRAGRRRDEAAAADRRLLDELATLRHGRSTP